MVSFCFLWCPKTPSSCPRKQRNGHSVLVGKENELFSEHLALGGFLLYYILYTLSPSVRLVDEIHQFSSSSERILRVLRRTFTKKRVLFLRCASFSGYLSDQHITVHTSLQSPCVGLTNRKYRGRSKRCSVLFACGAKPRSCSRGVIEVFRLCHKMSSWRTIAVCPLSCAFRLNLTNGCTEGNGGVPSLLTC